jgi:hypothetical protein
MVYNNFIKRRSIQLRQHYRYTHILREYYDRELVREGKLIYMRSI